MNQIFIIEGRKENVSGPDKEVWITLTGYGFFTKREEAESRVGKIAEKRYNDSIVEAKKNTEICKRIAADFKDHKIQHHREHWFEPLVIKFDPNTDQGKEIEIFIRNTVGWVCFRSWDEIKIYVQTDLNEAIKKALDENFSITPSKTLEQILKEYAVVDMKKGEA